MKNISILKPILNKFNLYTTKSLIFLIFLAYLSPSQLIYPLAQASTNIPFETIVKPDIARQGDTISVKIAKLPGEKSIPKIFFDKTKVPVFSLSENWYRTLLPISANCKAGTYQIEIFYKGPVKKINLTVKDTKYPLQDLTLPKEVSELKASRIEKDLVGKALNIYSSEKFWSGKFIFPSSGPLSTTYGVKRRVNGTINPDYFHKGLDFAAAQGSNIKAPENGRVVLVGLVSKGFVVNGNCIFIDHGHGVITGYLHLSSVLVKEGDFVKKGQLIGKVGSTGIASGPHLHWGVYVLGKTVEPMVWTKTVVE